VVAEMGISAYQVYKVVRAYNKQSRLKSRLEINSAPSPDKYADVVTLSSSEGLVAETYNKIAYNLVGVLLKDKTTAM
jgi:hypothetical protein